MNIRFEQSPALARLPGIRHGFFGRRGGHSTGLFASLNMSTSTGDRPNLVEKNRAAALAALGLPPDSLAVMRQTHSTIVLGVNRPPGEAERPEADGMVTNMPGVALGILTADCTPILLADPVARVIGAAHAGWKGATQGIAGKVVDAMVSLGAEPERIIAAIGPTISYKNYEVGPDFARNLLATYRDAANRIGKPDGAEREHFDLPGFVFDQLHDAGIGLVDDLRLCTYGEPKRYFSHRYATERQWVAGRQISIIALD